MMDWNRKDCSASETIKSITNILKSIGIETYIISKNECEDYWYSYNIGIQGLPGIYTNGKGVSQEYAMASALGEMMERLENNILLGQMFVQDEEVTEDISDEKLMNLYEQNWNEYFVDDNCADKWKNFLRENKSFRRIEVFERLGDNKQKAFPIDFIAYINGSNGACAGNTREEALTQGLAEVFERFVLKEIYFGNGELQFPDIPQEYFEKMNSYHLIKNIEDKGYQVRVKDLTLNGKVPVLGLIIFDSKNQKYKFSIASDLDIDICLQRCITETFQGRDINHTFRRDMKKVLCDSSISEKAWESCKKTEYMRNLISGEGKLPNKLLVKEITENLKLEPFFKSKKDNRECLDKMYDLTKDMGWEVWVKDNSYLQFPAYRIYVKNITDAFVLPDENIIEEIMAVYKLKKQLFHVNSLAKEELKELYYLIRKVRAYPRYIMRKNGLISFCGVIYNGSTYECDSWDEMQFAIGLKADIPTEELIELNVERPELSKEDKWKNFQKKYNLYFIKDDISSLLDKLISDLYGKSSLPNLIDDIVFPTCNNCSICPLKKECAKDFVSEIKKENQYGRSSIAKNE